MRNILTAITMALFAAALPVKAQNMIVDSDCDKNPEAGESSIAEGAQQGKLTQFVEDATWNRCLKFELTDFSTDKDGKRRVNTGLRIGGTKKLFGFPCKPETTYKFSLEIKGDAPRAMLDAYEWSDMESNSYRNRKKARTSVHLIMPRKEWTVYSGTFKTSATAKRASLCVKFWGDEARKDLKEKVGQYVLIDKITVEEVKPGLFDQGKAEVRSESLAFGKKEAAKVCIVPDAPDKAASLADFRDLKEDKPARYPSECTVWQDGTALHFHLEFRGVKPTAEFSGTGGNGIWTDDLAEFLFAPVTPDRRLSQFVVSAGGGRWMSNGAAEVDRYGEWQAECKVLPDGWQADVTIPFTLLGYPKAPGPGDFIGFNLGRQYIDPGFYRDKPDFSKGNRWGRGRMFDNSSWSRGYSDLKKFGVLFFGTMQPYAEKVLSEITAPELAELKRQVDLSDPGTAWVRLDELKEKARLLKLSGEKFLVAQIPPATDPAIPFLPDELNNPQKEFQVTAAVNEHAPLALALANMSGNFEEYRVSLVRGWEQPEPQVEYWYCEPGLKQQDGTVFPANRITIRRGIRGRDSETPDAKERFDILAKVNEASTIPVPSREGALVWIDFDCRGVKPGTYQGKLVVTPLSANRVKSAKRGPAGFRIQDTLTKEIPVKLTVLPFELDESDMPLNGYRSAYRQYQFDLMKEYSCAMYMVTPWHFRFRFAPDGSIQEEKLTPCLEPHIRLLAANAAAMPKGIRKVMIGYGAYDIFRRVHMRGAGIEYDSPAYWNAWREWSKAMDRIMTRNGFAREDYTVEVVDEPHEDKFPVAEMKKACEEMKQAVPGIHLTLTSGIKIYGKELSGIIDGWIFSHYSIYERTETPLIDAFTALPGKEWAVYCCATGMRQSLYRYYRIHAWKSLDLNSKYVGVYQFFAQQPGTDLRRMATDGELAYDTAQGLIPSVRLENLRIGLTDARYILLLKKLAENDDSAEAKAARAFLKTAAHDVAAVFPHDPGKADTVRKKAVEWILKLQEKAKR